MLILPPPTPLPSPFSHTLPVPLRHHLLLPLSAFPASTAAAVSTASQPFHLEVVSNSEDDVLPSHSVRYDFSPLLSYLSASPYLSVPNSSSPTSASLDPTDFRLAESYRAVPLPLWHSLLKALTSSSASAVSEFGDSPSLAYAVVLWLQKHNLCFSYELLYSILINSLGRSDKLYEAFLLSHRHTLNPFTYNALICACARHLDFDKAFNLLHRMRLDGYQPDFINYSTLVQCLIRGKGQGGRMEGSVLDKICAEVQGDRVELDSQLFNDVIIGFAKAGDADAALKYLGIAQGCGLSVKTGSFVAVVSVLGDFGRVEEAEAVFEEMKEGGLQPRTRAYNGLLKGYVKAGSLKNAEFIVSEMERNDVLPDEYTYTFLVDAYIREDRWESAQVLLKEMEARDLKLSTLVFGRMVVRYRDKGEWQKTFQVLREMKKCGVRPDRHFYNVMIDTFGKYKCLDLVMTTFDKMLREGIEPDNVTWNTLIDCHTKSEKYERAEELFQEMRERGSSPCNTTYNIMINCLGLQQKCEDVKRLFSEMQSEGLIPNVVTYTTLIDVFGKSGRFDDAVECIENMKSAGLNPSSTMYNALINGYAQRGLSDKALDTFKAMTADGLKPSLVALNSLINAFGEDRRDVEAFTVLQYMKENNLKADVVTFTTLMKALIRVDKFHKVPDVYEEMILSGCTPDKKAKDMFRSALRYMKLTLKPTVIG